jgi:L-threonylcarbamoyladenylate synthase
MLKKSQFFGTIVPLGMREAVNSIEMDPIVNEKTNIKALSYTHENLLEVAKVIKDGGLAVFPTDTVYDIGCSVKQPEALKRIFKIKDRPLNQSLSILISRPEVALEIADFKEKDLDILKKIWPGPWTLITRARVHMAQGGVGPDGTVALRCPDHGIALELLRNVGDTLAVSSANLSGGTSPVRFDEVASEILEQVDAAIDAGNCPLGGETAVVKFDRKQFSIVRTGCVSQEEVARVERLVAQLVQS